MSEQIPSDILPPFGVRGLSGHGNPPTIIRITAPEYDASVKQEPRSVLTYLDEDDGETVTVGSGLELSQRLQDPVPEIQYGSPSAAVHSLNSSLPNQKIHLFDIKHTFDNYRVWMKHEKTSRYRGYLVENRTVKSEDGTMDDYDSQPATRKVKPIRTLPAMTFPTDWMNNKHANKPQDNDSKSAFQPTTTALVTGPSSNQDRKDLPTPASLCDLDSTCPLDEKTEQKSQTSQHTVTPVEPAVQSQTTQPPVTAMNIDTVLGGVADFLQITANILRKTAEKTRESDTTPVEDLLSGFKDIVTEVAGAGIDILQALEQKSASYAKTPAPLTIQMPPIHPDLSDLRFDGLSHTDEKEKSLQPSVESCSSSVTSHLSVSDVQSTFSEPVTSEPSLLERGLLDQNNSASKSNTFTTTASELQSTDLSTSFPASTSGLSRSMLEPEFSARYPPIINWSSMNKIKSYRDNTASASESRLPGSWPDTKPAELSSILPVSNPSHQKPLIDNSLYSSSFPFATSPPGLSKVSKSNSTWKSSPPQEIAVPSIQPGMNHARSNNSTTTTKEHHNEPNLPPYVLSPPSDQEMNKRYSNPLFKRCSQPACTANIAPAIRRSQTVNHKPHAGPTAMFHTQPSMERVIYPKPPLPSLHDNPHSDTPKLPGAFPESALPPIHDRAKRHHQNLHLRHSHSLNLGPSRTHHNEHRHFVPPPSSSPPRGPPGYFPHPYPTAIPFPPPPPPAPPVVTMSFPPHVPTTSDLFGEGRRLVQDRTEPVTRSSRPILPNSNDPRIAQPETKVQGCIHQLTQLGYGRNDATEMSRLHLYASAADGDLNEAVDMIEEDRQLNKFFTR